MIKEPEYNNCFMCGKDNPFGLQLKFSYSEEETWADWVPERKYEGYDEVLHGGIIAALLDEVMAKDILIRGITAVTTDLNVKYRKAIKIGESIRIKGRITQDKGRVVLCTAEIVSSEGVLKVTGTATYFVLKRSN